MPHKKENSAGLESQRIMKENLQRVESVGIKVKCNECSGHPLGEILPRKQSIRAIDV